MRGKDLFTETTNITEEVNTNQWKTSHIHGLKYLILLKCQPTQNNL